MLVASVSIDPDKAEKCSGQGHGAIPDDGSLRGVVSRRSAEVTCDKIRNSRRCRPYPMRHAGEQVAVGCTRRLSVLPVQWRICIGNLNVAVELISIFGAPPDYSKRGKGPHLAAVQS